MQPILRVDLSSQEVTQFEIPREWQESYLGGASLAARLLYEYLTTSLDPLSPEAPLLFLNGPLTGTSGPAVGRFVVCGRSPATGLWGESNCGGFWGPELRKAGFDGLWIQGRSDVPVYLWIKNGSVEIKTAGHLWGKDPYETQAVIKAELNAGQIRIASIGLAGEGRIPFAMILCDHGRVAGRTGMGAVMGAKNLKAIAIKGDGTIPVNDPKTFKFIRSQANRALREDAVASVARELGTSAVAEYFDYLNEMPKHYFQNGKLDQEVLRTSGSVMKETILVGISACHACVIACGRVVQMQDGEKRKGPEYETLVGFGPNLGLNDAELATRLGELCDRYGMDTISMSNIIGLAFRLFDMGMITEKDTGGLKLSWGDPDPVESLIHRTARREGFGAKLADGARALGQRFGAEDEAVQVNGLEVPYHDPRGASGIALVYATSPRGACHNQSDYFLVDIGQVEPELGMVFYERLAGAQKAGNIAIHQNWRTIFNSAVICLFANISPGSLRDLINAACGYEWEIDDLLLAGERGWNLKRAINLRLGLTRENDNLPKSFLRPYSDAEENELFTPDFKAMLLAYYQARGWEPTNGYPSLNKLRELSLDFVAKDLYSQHNLSGGNNEARQRV